jgi:hypothetical protein
LVIDNYQAPQSDLGEVGPDKGKGGNYLLVSPEADVLIDHVADDVITSISNLVFVGTRIISLKGEECNKSLTAHRVCKVGSNRKQPEETEIYSRITQVPTVGHSVARSGILGGPESSPSE